MKQDGLKLVLSSLHAALGKDKEELLPHQRVAIRKVIMSLFIKPTLSFGEGMELVDQLQLAGLAVDPPGFSQLAEALSNLV